MISLAGRLTTTARAAAGRRRRRGHAIAQAFIRLDAGQFLGEPTAHLRPGIAAHQRLEAESGAQLIPQRLTAAVVDPGIDLGGGEPERHVAKVRERGGTAGPRDFRGVVHVGKARRNRVEGFERPDQLTGCEYLDVEPAAGKRADRCRDTFGARLQAG